MSWRDKCDLICSPLGMYSMLRDPFIISIIDDNGDLDQLSLLEICQNIRNMGGNGIRAFCWWFNTEESREKLNPFFVKLQKPDYNKYEMYLNDKYTDDWAEIARIINSCGLKLWFSLFEADNIRTNPELSPWNIFPGFFYSPKAALWRRMYIRDMVTVFRKNKNVVGYALCNEPEINEEFGITGPVISEFLADTFETLITLDVPPEDINLGIQYPKKKSDPLYGKIYRDFRNKVMRRLKDPLWGDWLKSKCISPCHNMRPENLEKLLAEARPNTRRNKLISAADWRDEQKRPNAAELYNMATLILETQWKAAKNGRLSFGGIYGPTKNNPLDTFSGIVNAYYDFYKEQPYNRRKYLEKLQEEK